MSGSEVRNTHPTELAAGRLVGWPGPARADFSTEPSALIATAVWATAAMTRAYATINPAAAQREIQAL